MQPSRVTGLRPALRSLLAGLSMAWLCAGTALAQAQPPKASPAALATHEQQLQLIRQALLDATLDATPTQVISSAWVDGRGALHENHEFHSRAEVRGVRVLSYLNDGEEPKARVSAEVLPWGWRQRDAESSCDTPPRAWRLPMTVTTRLEPGFGGSQQAAAQAVLASAREGWWGLMSGSRWTPASWTPPPTNTYHRALQAPAGESRSDWVTTLTLRPAPGEHNPGLAGWLPWNPTLWQWTLELQIAQRMPGSGEFRPVYSQLMQILIEPELVSAHPLRWLQGLQPSLMNGLLGWQQNFDAQTRCEPTQFVVRRDADAALRLQAGMGSGLRAGDRVLLMQPGWVPSRLLDSRSVEHLALAEVVQIGARHTEIRQLAGPPLARQGEWVALPL